MHSIHTEADINNNRFHHRPEEVPEKGPEEVPPNDPSPPDEVPPPEPPQPVPPENPQNCLLIA